MAIDPVCGMKLEEQRAAGRFSYAGTTYYCCSSKCLHDFQAKPAAFVCQGEVSNTAVDSPAPPNRAVAPAAALRHAVIPVSGMTCPDCQAKIESALRERPGVAHAAVNLHTGVAVIDYDPARGRMQDFLDAIRAAGFTPGTARARLAVRGMTCASCVAAVERALTKTQGVLDASVNPALAEASVLYEPRVIDFAGLKRAIEASGYRAADAPAATETGVDKQEQERRQEYRTLMRKFWFAAVISVPVLVFSYPQLFPRLREWLVPGSGERRLVWALLGVVTLPVLLWSGSQFFTGMWAALKHRAANMHTLIAIGIGAALRPQNSRSDGGY